MSASSLDLIRADMAVRAPIGGPGNGRTVLQKLTPTWKPANRAPAATSSLWLLARLAFTCVLPTLLQFVAQASEADLILHGGKVVTVDERFSIHEAIAVEGGRIVQVGGDSEVLQRRGPRTEVMDLQGRLVLPGLMDSHAHPADACMTELDHPIPPMETIPDVLDYIQARGRALKEGEWIEVHQVFITRLREQRYPTRAELDRAAPKHP
ncbi:MAG TPA: amidohydrolase family protein, partial [Verrucomicrobiae bacterium]|nr:amidohydrolase family protein [Verrucomicrobiae bacterium]